MKTNRIFEAISRLKSVISLILPYKHLAVTKEEWEAEYSGGQWDRLRSVEELAHYSVIAGYYHYFKQGGSILDVGCGEGILHESLSPYNYSRYVGIDISEEAIRRGARKQDERTSFIRADVDNYTPDESFDTIIFSETLYYFENPGGIMKKYASFLNKSGIFIISVYGKRERNMLVWKMIEKVCVVVDEVRVYHHSGKFWVIKVVKPSEVGSDK